MKVAILAHTFASHVLPMAQGLKKMFEQIDVQSKIFFTGLRWLTITNPFYNDQKSTSHELKTYIKKKFLNLYLAQLMNYDLIIIVVNMPVAFMKHLKVEAIRELFPSKPIVLFDLHYLPTMGNWAKTLRNGNREHGIQFSEGGNYGLERYDWYLMASVVHEYPMPPGLRQPYSLVGLNLDDGTLYPEKKDKFIALLDFERAQRLEERVIQIQALEETNTEYIILKDHYSIQEIRAIYRKCSIYFVAWRESFGLPICELQACGSYVFTPYARWCPSHWMKKDLSVAGAGELSPNFIVYDNDKEALVNKINMIKKDYDPQLVFDTFIQYQPQLFYGDIDQLRHFLQMIEDGEIHSRSHENYCNWEIIDQL